MAGSVKVQLLAHTGTKKIREERKEPPRPKVAKKSIPVLKPNLSCRLVWLVLHRFDEEVVHLERPAASRTQQHQNLLSSEPVWRW